MITEVEYKNSRNIVRNWLLVKYQIINNTFAGICLSTYYGTPQLLYDISCPGAGLFFDDESFEKMKKVGYFTGRPGRYLGEGGTNITEKTLEELKLEKENYEQETRQLIDKGYKLFMESETIEDICRKEGGRLSLWKLIYGLYLIPEKEIQNLEKGVLLVSSIDAREIIYDGNIDLQVKNGFSTYGVRIMPKYIDEALLKDE